MPEQSTLPDAPPDTRAVDAVDDYHGTRVEDPFRWLEDQDSPEVLAWADRQNVYTEAHLQLADSRDAIRRRLTELWNFERYSVPERHGDVWIFSKNDGLQNQSVVYKAAAAEAEGEVLLDPNTLSEDGTVALGGVSASHDGRYLAYATSKSGSDWRDWHVLDIASGEQLEDHLVWTKFTSAAWTEDAAGFFYQRYAAPESGEVYEATNEAPQLCYHRLGTPQSEDRVVYERPDQPKWGFGASVTRDGKYAVLRISAGTDRRNRVAIIDLEDESWAVRPLLMDFDASYGFIARHGDHLLFRTDNAAANGRVIAVHPDAPDPANWIEVLPESADKLESVDLCGGLLVTRYLTEARHEMRLFQTDGKPAGAVTLPGIGSVSSVSGHPDRPRVLFGFQSFTRPTSVYSFDLGTRELTTVRSPKLGFDPDQFETRQVSFQADDGTRLMMFLVHKAGMRLDGSNPTYLYGYGGFNISLRPRFSVPNLVWAERGGLFVQATLRGGGEFGEEWHTAGMLKNKQNVFDDFAACARYLVRNDYTAPQRLAIGGGSNGGLLVGATLNQHPELFGAAIPEVGVMDMLRYHTFTIGWAWASEYGRSDDPDMFPTLYAYSPLHNVRSDVRYPPTMVMTGDHDDRVLPGHSYKYAAALQLAQPDSAILLRVQRKAGHGAGKPVKMRIAEAADRWAFLDWALDA